MARSKISLSSLLDEVPEVPTGVEVPAAEPEKALSPAPVPPHEESADSTGAKQSAIQSDTPTAPVDQVADEPAEDASPQDLGRGDFPAEPASTKPTRAIEAKATKQRSASPVRSIKAAPEPPPLPLYLELTRKEARFRQDQLNDLTTLTRQLNRRRGSTGERITDNTLIRVAVDMMLKVADALDGATESELLDAVSARLNR